MASQYIIDHSLYPQSDISHIPEGQYALVRFTNGPPQEDEGNQDSASTVWLYDMQNKVYQPFLSWDSLKNAFPNIPEDQLSSRINLTDTSALSHPDFQGTFLDHSYGIDGTGKPLKTYDTGGNTTGSALSRYGMTASSPEDEETMHNIIGLALTDFRQSGAISQAAFDTISKDPTALTRYAFASMYGGYTFSDIYKDVKAKDLAMNGNASYANFKAIDDNVPADKFYGTPEGQKSLSDLTLSPPSSINLDPNFFNLPITQVPSEAFKAFISPVDTSDPKFKEEADKIQTGWFDIMNAQMNAQTQQDKAVADQNYSDFVTSLNQRYGIQLSMNARDAYNQLRDMFDQGSQRGIANSGIIDNVMDRKLQDIRKSNDYLRTVRDETLDANQRTQLLTNGTPDQIRQAVSKLDAEDQAKGIDPAMYRSHLWGLVPSPETKAAFSMETLKKNNPDASDDDLKKAQRLVLDSNGNYMSSLYQNLYNKQFNLQGTGTDTQRETAQQISLAQTKEDAEKKAMLHFTSGNPLSSYQGGNPTTPTPPVPPTPPTSIPAPTPQPAPYKPSLNTSGTGFNAAPSDDVAAGQAAEDAKKKATNPY